METTRQQKISRLIQKEMSEIFEFEMRNIFSGVMITVTKANVTKDLSVAKIYLSLFATKDKKAFLEKIRTHTSELRYKLGQRIRQQVRVIPQLEFFEDDSLDYLENIEKLLKK